MTKSLNMSAFDDLSHLVEAGDLQLSISDAALDPNTTLDFIKGQNQAYRAYNVQAASDPKWLSSPAGVVSLVSVTNAKGEMVGGVRVHLRRPNRPLQLEGRITHPQLQRLLAIHSDAAVETCGGWVTKAYRKTGVSEFMFLGAVALASLMKAKVVCGAAHTASCPLYERYGMGFDKSMPFAYPDERYQTFAGISDLEFPAQANHPARFAFAKIKEAIEAGKSYRFNAGIARTWDCPRAPAPNWDALLVTSNFPVTRVAQPQLTAQA